MQVPASGVAGGVGNAARSMGWHAAFPGTVRARIVGHVVTFLSKQRPGDSLKRIEQLAMSFENQKFQSCTSSKEYYDAIMGVVGPVMAQRQARRTDQSRAELKPDPTNTSPVSGVAAASAASVQRSEAFAGVGSQQLQDVYWRRHAVLVRFASVVKQHVARVPEGARERLQRWLAILEQTRESKATSVTTNDLAELNMIGQLVSRTERARRERMRGAATGLQAAPAFGGLAMPCGARMAELAERVAGLERDAPEILSVLSCALKSAMFHYAAAVTAGGPFECACGGMHPSSSKLRDGGAAWSFRRSSVAWHCLRSAELNREESKKQCAEGGTCSVSTSCSPCGRIFECDEKGNPIQRVGVGEKRQRPPDVGPEAEPNAKTRKLGIDPDAARKMLGLLSQQLGKA